MPRRNSKARSVPRGNTVRRKGISVYEYIAENPTPTSLRARMGADYPPSSTKRTRRRERKQQ